MAIRIRRGNQVDFDKNKLVQGELAIVFNKGELHFCYGAGNTKRLATKEDLQEMLDMSDTSYSALIQLIADLENDPNELTNILSNISALQSDKIDTTEKGVTIATLVDGKVPSEQLPPISSSASDITYDNTESGLQATDTQGAIDEVNSQLAEIMQQSVNIKHPPLAVMQAAHSIDEPGYEDFDSTEAIKGILANYKNVFIPEGTFLFSEDIIIDTEGTTLIGAGMDKSILKAKVENINGIVIGANGVFVSMLQVKDIVCEGSYERSAIKINSNVEGCVITYCKVVNSDDTGIKIGYLYDEINPGNSLPSKDNIVYGCYIENITGGSGIELINTENALVFGNFIKNTSQHGIRISGSCNCRVFANDIDTFGTSGFGHGVYNYGGSMGGVAVDFPCYGNIVAFNIIKGDRECFGFDEEASDIKVIGNKCTMNNAETAIGVLFNFSGAPATYGYEDITIENNDFKGLYNAGVKFSKGGKKVKIKNNVFFGFTVDGVRLNNHDVAIENTDIMDNTFTPDSSATNAVGVRNSGTVQKNVNVLGNVFNMQSKYAIRDFGGGINRGYIFRMEVTRNANKLNIASDALHTIETGDRIRFTTTGTLPTNLSTGTDYYAIRDSAEQIRVANTMANAIDLIGISLSDAGTGTHYVETCPRESNIINA